MAFEEPLRQILKREFNRNWPFLVGFGITFAVITKMSLGLTDEDAKNSPFVQRHGKRYKAPAFVPFGDIKDVTIPLDQATQKHRAFGFVTYLEKEDAAAAMDNMNNAELYGRVLTVNYAQPIRIKGGEQGWASQPLWADADTWFERQQQEEEMQRLQAEHQAVVRAAEEEERKKLAEERQGEVEEQEQNDDPMARAEAEVLAQNNAGS